jgi:lipopolysaccharide export system permease protein
LEVADLLLNRESPFLPIVEILATLVPVYLNLAIPAAVFLSVIQLLRLSGDAELDAIVNMGISLKRLFAPTWFSPSFWPLISALLEMSALST